MAQASKKQAPSDPLGKQLSRNVMEVSMIALGALAIYLFIALATYSPDDPGWSHAVSNQETLNSAGDVGAWIADVLLYLFGYMGHLFPVVFAYGGWRLFANRNQENRLDYLRYSIRGSGLILTYIGGCGLARLHFLAGSGLPYEVRGAGGILGDAIGSGLLPVLGLTGCTLVLLAVFLIGITLFTGFSWLTAMDITGRLTLRLFQYSSHLHRQLVSTLQGRSARKERETLIKIDREKVEKREPVKIEPKISLFETGERAEREKQVNLFEYPADSILPSLNLLDAAPLSTLEVAQGT